jgi:RAT1-interacting protein
MSCDQHSVHVSQLLQAVAAGPVHYAQPQEVACFSRSKSQVRFDRSALSTYKPAALNQSLESGFEAFVADECLKQKAFFPSLSLLDPVVAACNAHGVHTGSKSKSSGVDFVTYRNNLNKIMKTPYNNKDDWVFAAQSHQGCIFLDIRQTGKEFLPRDNEHQQRQCYTGYQFEHASTSPSVHGAEFCSVVRSTLGTHKLILAAEIDCTRSGGSGSSTASSTSSTSSSCTASDETKNAAPNASNVSATSTADYVELKTTRVLEKQQGGGISRQQHNFERHKVQC